MTGVTLELWPWQVAELRRYASGETITAKANANLVRRGFLEVVRTEGYKITSLGRAALAQAEQVRAERASGVTLDQIARAVLGVDAAQARAELASGEISDTPAGEAFRAVLALEEDSQRLKRIEERLIPDLENALAIVLAALERSERS